MNDVINAVCNDLVKNSHVIGILHNCKTIETIQCQEKTVNLCVISKETGNISTISQIGDFVVHIRWRTDQEFSEWVKTDDMTHAFCRILYDRTGILTDLLEDKKG